MPEWPASTACQVASAVMPSGDNDPQPTTAMRSGGFGMRGLDVHGLQVALNIRNGAELEQIFFLDTDAEAGIGFDQDFVEPQGINPDIFHEPGVRRD